MVTPNGNLELIDPGTVRELYLDHTKTDCSEATVQGHPYRTKHIVDWCDKQGIDSLNDLSGRNLHEPARDVERGNITQVTLPKHMRTRGVFQKWAV